MNTLPATLKSVHTSERLSCLCVDVFGDDFYVLLVETFNEPTGTSLTLAFKETEIILAFTETPCTANGTYGTIRDIRRGEVLSEVTFDYHGNALKALVPTLTFEPLGMEIGMHIGWAIQPSEISLMRENHGE